jgi:hypothetical protein
MSLKRKIKYEKLKNRKIGCSILEEDWPILLNNNINDDNFDHEIATKHDTTNHVQIPIDMNDEHQDEFLVNRPILICSDFDIAGCSSSSNSVTQEYNVKYQGPEDTGKAEDKIGFPDLIQAEALSYADVPNFFVDNYDTSGSSSSDDDLDDVDKASKLIHDWYQRNPSVPLSAANDLLKSLQILFPTLPLTMETIFRKSQLFCVQNIEIFKDAIGGEYVYFGVEHLLNQQFQNLELPKVSQNGVLLNISIDGIQIYKSGNSSVWATSLQIPCFFKDPLLLGVYIGKNKPSNNTLLHQLTADLRQIISKKFLLINNQEVYVDRISFICDCPARCMLKCTKGHTGYFACERCTIEGNYVDHSVVYDEMDQPLRTDASFCSKTNEEHHQGTSILETLKIDMVKNFILDSMHLLCLGVSRRLIYFWLHAGPLTCRLRAMHVLQINHSFSKCREYYSKIFSRVPRDLSEIKKFKATEFRNIILYTGVVSFYGVVEDSVFNNYLLFHVGYTILSSRKLCLKYAAFAQTCFYEFVRHSKQIYSSKFITYNVHNMLHIADDVVFNKMSLESLSAFPFENSYTHLKKALKSPYMQTQQIVNKLQQGFFKAHISRNRNSEIQFIKHINVNLQSIPPNYRNGTFYQTIKKNHFIISSKLADSFFSDEHGTIFQIIHIIKQNFDVILLCNSFEKTCFSDVYSYPCKSSLLGIFKYIGIMHSSCNSNTKAIRFLDVKIKYMCLPMSSKDSYAFFPLNVQPTEECEHCCN